MQGADMHIAIVGAGITGVSTALELAALGHSVAVFDQRGGVSTHTSFAHAGISSAALAGVWGGIHGLTPLGLQGSILTAPSWRLAARRAIKSRADGSAGALLEKLCTLSQARLALLRRQLQLDYERSEGLLVLLRSEREMRAAATFADALQSRGLAHQVLNPEQCVAREPGLNAHTPLSGGLLLPDAEVSNGRELCLLLRAAAQRLGVRFQFHSQVQRIEPGTRPSLTHEYHPHDGLAHIPRQSDARSAEGPQTQPMLRGPQRETFDAIVLCTGDLPEELMQQAQLNWPLMPVWGCSLTAPLRQLEAHPDLGPRAALIDEKHQVSISRIGQRVRVSGGALLTAPGDAKTQNQMLHQVLHDWFPGAAQTGHFQQWQGARSMAPDALPVIGATKASGIWMNVAHGGLGAALAQGAAQVLAQQIGRQEPGLDISPLSPARLG